MCEPMTRKYEVYQPFTSHEPTNDDHIPKNATFQLSWIERKMAATLFAAPPTASLPEAVQHFLQVIVLFLIFIDIFSIVILPKPQSQKPLS